jgi:hypothetical protein
LTRMCASREDAECFLQEAGIEVRRRRSNLEDVFVKLTGERIEK